MAIQPNDFLFFVGEEWTPFSQREQSIALECAARGHRVFYFEPMLSIPKAAAWAMKGRSLRPPDPGQPGLTVLRPKLSLWAFRGSPLRAIDRRIFSAWYQGVRREHSISDEAVLFMNLPYWWENIVTPEAVSFSRLVYDCIDDCRVYSRTERVLCLMEESELRLTRRADLVLATAQVLKDKLSAWSNRVHLLSNGVDTRRFLGPESGLLPPPDLEGLPGPIFGFVGALYYWIDFEAIEALAKAYPSASVVLVGPRDGSFPEDLPRRCPNVHVLGPRLYEQVPAYMRAFDVCLNPFRMGPLGDTINPLKLYEYLCLGKPVLSARTRETERFADHLYLYGSHEELVVMAARALGEPRGLGEGRRDLAAANSWTGKVDVLEGLLWPDLPEVQA